MAVLVYPQRDTKPASPPFGGVGVEVPSANPPCGGVGEAAPGDMRAPAGVVGAAVGGGEEAMIAR